MKKLLFIVMMLFVANFAFSDQDEDEIKALMQKNEDYYQQFQDMFKNLRAYDSSKRSRDTLMQMQSMLDRQKRLVDFKMEEIRVMESGGKTVPIAEFSRLKELMDRYHQMSVEVTNWTNNKK